MGTRSARLSAALAAAAALLLGAPAGPPGAEAASELAEARAGQPAQQVREYWTQARMSAARPVELRLAAGAPSGGAAPRQSRGVPRTIRPQPARRAASDVSAASAAFPERTHGKVFFTIAGGSSPGDYVCSGTVVDSPSHTLVWTAGHCVNDAAFGGGFATNWLFVPGYRDGEKPFGEWPARTLFAPEAWREEANMRVDLGAARVARDAQGRGIEDVVGARGIAFNLARDQEFRAFGYPAVATLLRPEFDGERLYACDSSRTADDAPPGAGPATLEIECDQSAGSSGGGWVIEGGVVNSVTSYSYLGDFDHLYGTYLGAVAEELYAEARGARIRCGRREVTNLGGAGPDSFLGTELEDTIRLRGGDDDASAGAGADRLCGGTGRDVLRGGPGRDVCVGGPGRDQAVGCEVRRELP